MTKSEKDKQRDEMILSTGRFVRFTLCTFVLGIVAGVILTHLFPSLR